MWLATFAALSLAADTTEIGIPVTFEVLDVEGAPIPTAVIRHPKEQDRHRVNVETGRAVVSALYLPDGTEVLFTKGLELEFEISAPGFQNVHLTYLVRKRRNLVPVELEKLDVQSLVGGEEDEDPVIQFGRDKPID